MSERSRCLTIISCKKERILKSSSLQALIFWWGIVILIYTKHISWTQNVRTLIGYKHEIKRVKMPIIITKNKSIRIMLLSKHIWHHQNIIQDVLINLKANITYMILFYFLCVFLMLYTSECNNVSMGAALFPLWFVCILYFPIFPIFLFVCPFFC